MRCKLHLIRSRLAGNKRPKTSLRAWSRLTAHYQVLPCSHQYYRVRPTPSSSHPLFSQSHPWKDRQKSFICSKNTTVKREERRGDCVLIGGTKVAGEPRRYPPSLTSWYSPHFEISIAIIISNESHSPSPSQDIFPTRTGSLICCHQHQHQPAQPSVWRPGWPTHWTCSALTLTWLSSPVPLQL